MRFNALRLLGLSSRGKLKEELKKRHIHSRQYRIPPEHPWIPVRSAFGGLGLYRSVALDGHWYDSGPRYGRPVCEHVRLHQRMVDVGARLYIVPELLNTAPPGHLGPGSGNPLPFDFELS